MLNAGPPAAAAAAPTSRPNAFQLMRQGAINNPKQDLNEAKRKQRKFDRIVYTKEQMDSKKAEQRGTNNTNRKRERDADASEILHETASVAVPQPWLAPPWRHGPNNHKALDLFVVGHKSAEVAAEDCPAGMISLHPNEARLTMSHNMKDPRGKFAQMAKEKKAPSQVRVIENRLDVVDEHGCPSIVRVHGHERSFYVRAPDAVAEVVLKSAFKEEMEEQARNKETGAKDAKGMALATSKTRLALPPIDTPAELLPIKDHHAGKTRGWHWKQLQEHKKVCKAADAEARKQGKKKAESYPPTEYSLRLDAEKALEARRQAHLVYKKETWAVVRKARDHALTGNAHATRWGSRLRDVLEQHLEVDKSLEWPSGGFCYHLVSSVVPVLRQSILGYDFDEQSLYYRITVSLPRVQNKLVKFLQTTGVTVDGSHHVFGDKDLGNAEEDYDLQFLVENNLAGQSWITLPAGTYKITTGPVPAEMMNRVGEPTRDFEADRQDDSSRSGSDKSTGDGEGEGAGDTTSDAPPRKRVRAVVGYEEDQPGEPAGALGVNARKTWYRAEIDINFRALLSHYREKGKWERIVPLRTISWDIECLDGDTQVAIDGGLSMRIKDIKPGTKVLAYDPATKGLVPRTVTHHLPRGDKECVELLFNDGRKMVCTRDHKILTATGEFVEADQLRVGETEVTAGIEYPCVSPGEDQERSEQWSLDTTDTLGFALNMTDRKNEALAFARLLGWLLTDGNVAVSHTKAGQSTLYVGHELDRRVICDDINTIVGSFPTWRFDHKLFYVNVRNHLHRAFQSVGAKPGTKIAQLTDIPEFLSHPECPLPLVREFLGGLFGGDGTTVCVSRSGSKVLFSPIGFTMSKKGLCVKQQFELLGEKLYFMLERCGVPTGEINAFPTETITHKNRPEDQAARKAAGQVVSPTLTWDEEFKADVSYAINMNFPASACLPFLRNVGFRYSCHKQMRLTAACAYWRQKDLINDQRKAIRIRVENLLSNPDAPSIPDAVRRAKLAEGDVSTLHPAVMAWNPLHLGALAKHARGGVIDRSAALNVFDIAKFFSEKRRKRKYSALVRSEEIEVAAAAGNVAPPAEAEPVDDTTTRYGVHKDSTSLPTFRVKLIAKRTVGIRTVYDLSVPVPGAPEGDDTWDSFTANGVVVHNCGAQKPGRFPVANPKINGLPDPREDGDPVISISVVLQNGDDTKRRRKAVLIWRLPADRRNKAVHIEDPDDIDLYERDCEIWMYRDERDMMIGFAELMRSCQPSVLVTYNGNNFDVPYLIDRALKLQLDNFPFWSPVKELVTIKASTYQSKAMGVQNRLDPIIPGVLNFDLCRHIQTTEKHSSYTLNAIAEDTLKQKKDDLHHCIDANSFVSLVDGTSVSIKELATQQRSVWALHSEQEGTPTATPAQQTHWFDQGVRECVELVTEGGNHLTCTPDHKVWSQQTQEGDDPALPVPWRWIEAQHLRPEIARIATTVDNPHDDRGADEAGWSLQMGNFTFQMNTEEHRRRTLAFARFLGYLLTDGNIHQPKRAAPGKLTAAIFLGHELDTIPCLDDIEMLCGVRPPVSPATIDHSIYTISIPTSISQQLYHLPGVMTGCRVEGTATLPDFILHEQCPLSVIREFLGGLFGGDGGTPCLVKQDKSILFSQVNIAHSRRVAQLPSLLRMYEQIQVLMAKLGVGDTQITGPVYSPGTGTYKLSVHDSDLVKFSERIGFRYCHHKMLRVSAAASYRRYHAAVVAQNQWVIDRVEELTKYRESRLLAKLQEPNAVASRTRFLVQRRMPMNVRPALAQAIRELKAREAILHPSCSIPVYGGVMNCLGAQDSKPGRWKQTKFSPLLWLQSNNALDIFLHKDDPKRNALVVVPAEVVADAVHPNPRGEDEQEGVLILQPNEPVNIPVVLEAGVDAPEIIDEDVDEEEEQRSKKKCKYGMDRVQMTLPTLSSRLISITNVGPRPVYDISVARHVSFVANGMVVHNSLISKMFYGTRAQRKRLCAYNERDSILPLDIIQKKKINFALAEIARVTGTTNSWILTKGQGVKTESQLHRLLLQYGLVAPILPHKNKKEITTMEEMIEQEEVQFTGAVCVEPKIGLYEKPIATLDFASLYPSEMLAHNLDYATYILDPADLERLHPDDYEAIHCPRPTLENPDAEIVYYYVKRHMRQGMCPLLLANLLAERGNVKSAMKKVDSSSDEYGILDARSVALKLSANSTYGFCAGFVLHLPAISESVCAMGRQALRQTIALVEGHFTKANGYPDDAIIIYGDTDSVMIKFGVDSVEEASNLAFEAECLVNESFADQSPMSVVFEKVYKPYLLMIKKTYAGLKYEPGEVESSYHYDPEHPAAKKNKCNYAPDVEGSYLPTLDCKGIEPKRRDKIPFIKRTMLQALDYIFWERDIPRALKYCGDEITKLIQGEIDLSEIIKSKSLKLGQVGESPQASVAAKRAARDPATAPGNGSRISWVPLLIPGKGKNEAKKYETAEDPMFALKNHLPIDYKAVAESEVYNALHRLFKYCFYKDDKSDAENVAHSEASMAPMFAPIETARFIDDRPLGGPMARFAKVVDSCKKCHAVIRLGQEEQQNGPVAMTDAQPDDPAFAVHEGDDGDDLTMADRMAIAADLPNVPGGVPGAAAVLLQRRPGSRVVCARCINHLPMLREQNAAKIEVLRKASQVIWDKCAACSEAPLDCSNDDCKIFYKREAVNEQLSEALARKVKIDF